MKFKLDENLGHSVVSLFRDLGYEVCTVSDQNLTSSPDDEIFKVCMNEKYCLVTLDKDFSQILNYPPETSYGIVVLRISGKVTLADIHILVRQFLNTLGSNAMNGKLWIVEKNRIREYQKDQS